MSERTLAARDGGDEALLDRARAGDEAALNALVSNHYRGVYEVTYRVLGDPELAADAAQDAFVKAVSALAGFRGESSFRTWLLRIASNTARSSGRRKTSRREVELEPESHVGVGSSDPSRDAVLRTEAERAARALQELPEKQRLAVSLRIYQDLSHREIAEVLGSSEGAARVNYHLGIKRLRELLG
jgi:RNA polymerase sigma-70 factor, ECF subfamily